MTFAPDDPANDYEPDPTCHGCDRLATDLDGRCDRCAALPDQFWGPVVARLLDDDIASTARVVDGSTIRLDGQIYRLLDLDFGLGVVYRGDVDPDSQHAFCAIGNLDELIDAFAWVTP